MCGKDPGHLEKMMGAKVVMDMMVKVVLEVAV